jgi:glycosyltransferase involved in cell wall biosynthesis
MRLLLVTGMYPTPDRPHAGPFVARRVASLREGGADVVVAASSSYRHRGPIRHLQITWRALRAKGPFDGVEAHPLFAAGLIGLLVARLRRVPLVAYAHGGDVGDYARRNRVYRFLAGLVARGAKVVVTNSSDSAAHAAALGAHPLVVSPGVDFTVFRPAPETRRALRSSLGMPDGLVALYVGTLSKRKGADVFAAAIDLAPGWHGLAIGDGELAGELAARHPALVQRGPVPPEEVARWMQAADVVVVPSRREPLGLAAIEALACGTPVVAAAVGGLKEVIRDGENGLLVPPEDPEALAGALTRLADPRLRKRLAAAGPASVASHDRVAAAAAMDRIWAELGVGRGRDVTHG